MRRAASRPSMPSSRHHRNFVTRACATIVERGYGTVVTGGGDGTLAAAIEGVRAARAALGEADDALRGLPRFAALAGRPRGPGISD